LCDVVQISKANKGRTLGQTANRVETRSRAMARALRDWMRRYGKAIADEEIARQLKGKVSKAAGDQADLERQLAQILRAFGLRQMSGKFEGGVPPSVLDEFLATKDVRLQAITADTRTEIRGAVRGIIRRSMLEVPQPSVGEIARRIRSTFIATPGTSARLGKKPWEDLSADATEDGLVLPTTRVANESGEIYAMSSERAALIARTELAQAENTAIIEGLRAAGFTHKTWLAYTGAVYPSGSMRGPGDRRHDKMNEKTIPIDEPFVLPDGTLMQHPGDPSAPIKQLANCRCTIAGAGSKADAKRQAAAAKG